MIRSAVLIAGLLAWAVPLALSIGLALTTGLSPEGWGAFLAHPQIPFGLLLALWTGTAGLVLAVVAAIVMVMALHRTSAWRHMPLLCGAGLAVPHLAFAVGLGFLIMPSGVVARVFVGGEVPPQWVTTQDPLGLALIAVLALKEIPFIVLVLWSALAQDEGARSLQDQMRCARALGHGPRSAWLRVLLPQLLRRSAGPLIVVWVYGVTVVDLALVMGPTQPPTAGVAIWADLNDVAQGINRRGLAGTVVVTALLAVIGALAWLGLRLARQAVRRFLTRGPDATRLSFWPGAALGWAVVIVYLAVLLVLALLSLAPRWPYPDLWPETVSLASWGRLAVPPLIESLGLAGLSSLAAVTLIVMWFETHALRLDRAVMVLALAALALPALLIVAGQYRLFLVLGLTGTQTGLFLAHLTPVLAYAFILLRGPYRAFDARFTAAGRSLGAGPWRSWATIKLPLLRAPLAAALAVGFAVSLVQFVPAQLIAAGRYSTLPMEAVTLASGGNRSLTAAAALLLALPAFAAFALAGFAGEAQMALVLRGLAIMLGGRDLIQPFDLDIAPGETVTLMGPSGSGKSSILALIGGGLEPPLQGEGTVMLNGTRLDGLTPERRRIGRLFQDDLLFPHMTVGENLMFGIPRGAVDRHGQMREGLRRIGMEGFEHRAPHTLSGGQRARASLMRAVLAKPKAMLLDEPFNKLDAALRAGMRDFVFSHLAERRMPSLLVTHDRADAPWRGRVLEIGGDGEVRDA